MAVCHPVSPIMMLSGCSAARLCPKRAVDPKVGCGVELNASHSACLSRSRFA
jgi:hypothetical protein